MDRGEEERGENWNSEKSPTSIDLLHGHVCNWRQRHLVGQFKKMRPSWHEAQRNHNNCKQADRFKQHSINPRRETREAYRFRDGVNTHRMSALGQSRHMQCKKACPLYPNSGIAHEIEA